MPPNSMVSHPPVALRVCDGILTSMNNINPPKPPAGANPPVSPNPPLTVQQVIPPLPNYTLSSVCPACTAPTIRRACKVRCERCGFVWDCSEL